MQDQIYIDRPGRIKVPFNDQELTEVDYTDQDAHPIKAVGQLFHVDQAIDTFGEEEPLRVVKVDRTYDDNREIDQQTLEVKGKL